MSKSLPNRLSSISPNENQISQVGQRDLQVADKTSQYEELKATYCPYCNNGPLDGVTGVSETKEEIMIPEDGDPTICWKCQEVLVLRVKGEKRTIEIPTDEEIQKWKNDIYFWGQLTTLKQVLKKISDNDN